MQPFIEIERSVRKHNWSMHDLHSHSHYEIYYLSKGSRKLLLSNSIYHLDAPSLVVIPPHIMHKTEGGSFERYNIDIAPEFLNDFQLETLEQKALKLIKPNEEQHALLNSLLREMEKINKHEKNAYHRVISLFSYYIYQLSNITEIPHNILTIEQSKVSPLVLKSIDYLNVHYMEKQTLDQLASRFFVSKATLIYNFNKYLHCSPMDFLLNLRLTKAKEELLKTKKSIREISEDCGFSSPNYFSLIFKRKENLSPINYRKYQKTKT